MLYLPMQVAIVRAKPAGLVAAHEPEAGLMKASPKEAAQPWTPPNF
jgi:hypothetical protein